MKLESYFNQKLEKDQVRLIRLYTPSLILWLELPLDQIPKPGTEESKKLLKLKKEFQTLRRKLKIKAYRPEKLQDQRLSHLVKMFLKVSYLMDENSKDYLKLMKMKAQVLKEIDQVQKEKKASTILDFLQ